MPRPFDASMASGWSHPVHARDRGSPRWRVLRTREEKTFTARLMLSQIYQAWGIGISRPNTDEEFLGLAVFPDTMGRTAARRFDELKDDNSIEALLREFGTDEQYGDFMAFRLEE